MATVVDELIVRLDAEIKGFERGMKRAGTVSTSTTSKIKKNAAAMGAALKRAGAVMTVALAAAGVAFVGMVKKAAALGDNIAKTADKLGVGVEALQELRFAANQAGVSQQQFDMAIQRAGRRIAEAANGTGEAKKALQELDVELRNADGSIRSLDDILPELADKFSRMTDSQDKLRLAQKLFDSEGVIMVNLLNQGADGMEELRKRARELGIVLSEDAVRGAEQLTDRMSEMKAVIDANMARAILDNAGAIHDLMAQIIEGLPELIEWTRVWAEWLFDLEQTPLRQVELQIRAVNEEIENLQRGLNQGNSFIPGMGDDKELARLKATRAELEALKKDLEIIRMIGDPVAAGSQDPDGGPPREEFRPLGLPSKDELEETRDGVAELIAQLELELALVGMTTEQQELHLALLEAEALAKERGVELTEEEHELVRLLVEERQKLTAEVAAQQEQEQRALDLQLEAQAALRAAISDLIIHGEDFEDVLIRMAQRIAEMVLQTQILDKLFQNMGTGSSGGGGGLLGGVLSILGLGKAGGGKISGPVLVGERGPELFIPPMPGRIMNNADTRREMGGERGGVTINQTLNFEAGVTRQEVQDLIPRIRRETEAAVINSVRRNRALSNIMRGA